MPQTIIQVQSLATRASAASPDCLILLAVCLQAAVGPRHATEVLANLWSMRMLVVLVKLKLGTEQAAALPLLRALRRTRALRALRNAQTAAEAACAHALVAEVLLAVELLLLMALVTRSQPTLVDAPVSLSLAAEAPLANCTCKSKPTAQANCSQAPGGAQASHVLLPVTLCKRCSCTSLKAPTVAVYDRLLEAVGWRI